MHLISGEKITTRRFLQQSLQYSTCFGSSPREEATSDDPKTILPFIRSTWDACLSARLRQRRRPGILNTSGAGCSRHSHVEVAWQPGQALFQEDLTHAMGNQKEMEYLPHIDFAVDCYAYAT